MSKVNKATPLDMANTPSVRGNTRGTPMASQIRPNLPRIFGYDAVVCHNLRRVERYIIAWFNWLSEEAS
jgi:hypothetical protein